MTQDRRTILMIETSNPGAGPDASWVALGNTDGSLVDHEPVGRTRRGGDDLMPAVERLCARAGARPNELARIGVSVGPGGYTGLRVAVAGAAMLAEAAGALAVPVPTASLVARSLESAPRALGIALAAKGQSAHVSIARPDGIDDLGVVRADAIGQLGLAALAGDEHLHRSFGDEAERLAIPLLGVRFDPAAGIALAARSTPVDPGALAVRYAREPDAVTQWQKRHGG